MKNPVWLCTLVLIAGCYRVAGPRPLPRKDRPPDSRTPEPDFPRPRTYAEALRRLDAMRVEMRALADKERLFEIPDLAREMQFLTDQVRLLAGKEITDPILSRVSKSGELIADIGRLIRRAAERGQKENIRSLLDEAAQQVKLLERFSPLSDEYELKKVPPNCPNTYRRALRRIRGVQASLEEKFQGGDLRKMPPVAEHLVLVGENLKRIALNDISWPVENAVKQATESLRGSLSRIGRAAERDDAATVEHELGLLEEPIRKLDEPWLRYSGVSALQAPKAPESRPERR